MPRNNSIVAIFAVLSFLGLSRLCSSFLQPSSHRIHRGITHLSAVAATHPNLTEPIESAHSLIPNELGLNEHQIISQYGPAFAKKIMELAAYKQQRGNCLVPKRYKDNPSLGNFVNKQRQLYRKYLEGENNSMTQVSSFTFSTIDLQPAPRLMLHSNTIETGQNRHFEQTRVCIRHILHPNSQRFILAKNVQSTCRVP